MDLDYKSLIANIPDAVYFTDLERRITFWNKTAQEITGYSAEETVGKRCRDNLLVHVDQNGRSLCKNACPLAKTMQDRSTRDTRIYLHHKEGHRIPVQVRVVPLLDVDGNVIGAAEFFKDTSAVETMRERMEELQQLALLDPLTRLPNRHHIEPELEGRLQEMKRLNLFFGFVFLDIDHFKCFNDEYGHDTGDRALKTVARTLSAAVRPFDLVGRWGGEEFVAIVRSVNKSQLEIIANRLRLLISKSSIRCGKHQLQVTVSLGATMAEKSDTLTSLVNRADELMYRSKHEGRNRATIG